MVVVNEEDDWCNLLWICVQAALLWHTIAIYIFNIIFIIIYTHNKNIDILLCHGPFPSQGFFNSLRIELADYPGLTISTILPGPVQSQIVQNAFTESLNKVSLALCHTGELDHNQYQPISSSMLYCVLSFVDAHMWGIKSVDWLRLRFNGCT